MAEKLQPSSRVAIDKLQTRRSRPETSTSLGRHAVINRSPELTDRTAAPERLAEVSFSDDSVRDYLQQIAKTPLLTAEQEVLLAKKIEAGLMAQHLLDNEDTRRPLGATEAELGRIAEEGAVAKDHMIRANLRLVVSVAKKYGGPQSQLSHLDRISEGNQGLIHAVEKFDYQKGFKFSTYATWWIRQSLSRGEADHGPMIRLPIHTYEKVQKMRGAHSRLVSELGREPRPYEVAAACKMPEETVVNLWQYSKPIRSLDEPIGDDDGATLGDLHAEQSDFADSLLGSLATKSLVEGFLSVLDERSADILARRFGLNGYEEQTFIVIAQAWGVTRERIRQIEGEALKRLRSLAANRRL